MWTYTPKDHPQEDVSGIGGGMLLRTNLPNSLSDVGNLYIKHCYFENNYAARNADSNRKNGKGRGFFLYSY
jgi:hypothetical protein